MLSTINRYFKKVSLILTSFKMHFTFKHWYEVEDKELTKRK